MDIGMVHDYVEPGVNGYFLSGDPVADVELFADLETSRTSLQRLLDGAASKSGTAITWAESVRRNVGVYCEMMRPKPQRIFDRAAVA
jgi:hypothetical protein